MTVLAGSGGLWGRLRMPSPRELVEQVQILAPKCVVAAVVVIVDDEVRFVECGAPGEGDPLAELETLISRGGEPIGTFLSAPTVEGWLTIQLRLLPEFAGDESADRCLSQARAAAMRAVREKGCRAYISNPVLN